MTAYIVTLANGKGADVAETLILVPAENRAKAHLMAQQQIRERQGWMNPRIIESLRLPGEAGEAARLFTGIVEHHLAPSQPVGPVRPVADPKAELTQEVVE